MKGSKVTILLLIAFVACGAVKEAPQQRYDAVIAAERIALQLRFQLHSHQYQQLKQHHHIFESKLDHLLLLLKCNIVGT